MPPLPCRRLRRTLDCLRPATPTRVVQEPAAAAQQEEPPVLSAADRAHMRERGYVVVKRAVPRAAAAAVVDDIWAHMGMDRARPDGWYADPHGDGLKQDGFMRQAHTPAMWATRTAPRIYRAFAQLWGTAALWVDIDRCILKPPLRPDRPGWGERRQQPLEKWGSLEQQRRGLLHWDVDVANQPVPFQMYQSCLFLEDTAADQGTFQCVPGAHRWYAAWHAEQRAKGLEVHNSPPHEPRFEPTRIAGECGDCLIWDSFLPHGNCLNTSSRPRLAQFISMWPATAAGHEKSLGVFWPR